MERNEDQIIQNKKDLDNQNFWVFCIKSRFCENKKEEEGGQDGREGRDTVKGKSSTTETHYLNF